MLFIPRIRPELIGAFLAFLDRQPHKADKVDWWRNKEIQGIFPIQTDVMKPLDGSDEQENDGRDQYDARRYEDYYVLFYKSFINLKKA